MTSSLPPDAYAMIIGAMRCGTTSLFLQLKRHPQICAARKKEPEFFSENQHYGVPVENYEDLWDFDPAVHRYVLEASTGYTKYPLEPNVARNIRDHGIDPRFIYVVRDPFERIVSHVHFAKGFDGRRIAVSGGRFISYSNYYLQLQQYCEYFPRENILLLDLADLKTDTASALSRVYRFLGVDEPASSEPYPLKHKSKDKPRKLPASAQPSLRVLRRILPPSVKALGRRVLLAPPRRRALSARERRFIHAELHADMLRLQQEFGIDVAKWGFEA